MKSAIAHPDLLSYKLGLLVKEFAVVALREVALEDGLAVCDNPEQIAAYWRTNIATDPHFNAEVESCYVVILNTRHKPKGHHLVATGTIDTVFSHPREMFRAAIIAGAAAIVLMHNHPSGVTSPSEADIKMTRESIRAGELLRIAVLDHIVMGRAMPEQPKDYTSLRELGYFYS